MSGLLYCTVDCCETQSRGVRTLDGEGQRQVGFSPFRLRLGPFPGTAELAESPFFLSVMIQCGHFIYRVRSSESETVKSLKGRWTMSLNLLSPRHCATRFISLMALVTVVLLSSALVMAQTTVSQGSIQGTITDPSGAVVSGARIIITNRSTGQVVTTTTSSTGTYSSGALLPGNYWLKVEAKGFKTAATPVLVEVAVTSAGNIKLELGQESQVVEVQASSIQVNTEQATVQGVLTGDQIDKLPVDGRNFLDLAALEPGVQIQDGQDFDPTKAGYSSISINGVFGRTPRIELDGVDISDETVGK